MERTGVISLTDWLVFLKGGVEKSKKIKLLYNQGKIKKEGKIE